MKALMFLSAAVGMIALGACSPVQKDPYGLAGKTHSAVTPAMRGDPPSLARHQKILDEIASRKPDLIFVGDSITRRWEDTGKDVWDEYYARRNAINMGWGGDRTQNVLWRLQNGEIEKISPKLAIVMIGTNNSNDQDNAAEEIADGIKAICAELRTKLPKTKILLIAIFPRGEDPSPQREKNARASALASQIADGKTIFYLDITDKFLLPDGTLPKEIFPDFLHPDEKGYVIWAQAMEPIVSALMDEKR
ncbi:MAG: GDSL-type esterase/lipase family protein [Planctomycetaceae bacterium]|nr:GDSL-type esterase/lipase family protein [Planctomycetaceae bacterium]